MNLPAAAPAAHLLQVAVSNYGARLVQVAVPDGQGGLVDVALGYDSLQGYLDGQLSMGAFIGRWAGRLRGGKLHLPGGCTLSVRVYLPGPISLTLSP